jgi:hypothetical protein
MFLSGLKSPEMGPALTPAIFIIKPSATFLKTLSHCVKVAFIHDGVGNPTYLVLYGVILPCFLRLVKFSYAFALLL